MPVFDCRSIVVVQTEPTNLRRVDQENDEATNGLSITR